MTSEERHEARFRRRQEKRKRRRQELNKAYGDFDRVISIPKLCEAYYICRKGVSWKGSVMQYGLILMRHLLTSHRMLQRGEDTFKGFYTFDINERGKIRHIRSVHISERCIQKSICKNALVPMLSNGFIYDNGASLKYKGTSFTVDRLTGFLHKWYRRNGTEGYAIIGDFSKYFDSIDHEVACQTIRKAFEDRRFEKYIRQSISHYGKMGIGLGSEENQIIAVAVPNKLDQYIKTVKRVKAYTRFNDDFILLVREKEEARKILREIREVAASLKINLNEKKTHIVKISHGFTFLKIKFNITKTGKVIRRISPGKYIRERRKLKSFREFYDRGEMPIEYIREQYGAWCGTFHPGTKRHRYRIRYKRFQTYRSLKSMDRLFNELFNNEEGGEHVHPHQHRECGHRCHGTGKVHREKREDGRDRGDHRQKEGDRRHRDG